MRVWALPAIAVCALGCHDKSAVSTPDMAFAGAFAAHDKVDVLFVSGNESSTSQYRRELDVRFPELIKTLTAAAADHPASFHFGVITPDLGAGPFTKECAGNDGGRLIVGPGTATSFPPPSNCTGFSFTDGARFLAWDSGTDSANISSTLAVPDAFDCMTSFGDVGCGFQQPLEATYLALHGDVPENAGFLRDDALLVVVYIVDKDDCSVPDTDLMDPSDAAVAMYGPLSSFRCVQFGVSCGSPPGPLPLGAAIATRNDCVPLNQADGGKLIDIQKYIDFFSKPGGAKPDPSDVIVAAISPPPTPFGVSLGACPTPGSPANCPWVDHSCVAAVNPTVFGDPTVRLAAVVASAPTTQTASICDTSFSPPLADLAQKILARLK